MGKKKKSRERQTGNEFLEIIFRKDEEKILFAFSLFGKN